MAGNPTDPSADPMAADGQDMAADSAGTGAVDPGGTGAADPGGILPGGTLIVSGMNHRTAAQGLRDTLFLESDELPMVLSDIGASGIGEAMVLSTCDRVEVVAV